MVQEAPGRELGTQELPEGAVQEPDGSYAVDKPAEDEGGPKAPEPAPVAARPAPVPTSPAQKPAEPAADPS